MNMQQLGQVLDAHLDMIKAFMGDQFAVSIVARHKAGPVHLLIGDDPELVLIATLSELQRTALDVGPRAVAEPTPMDHAVNLLRECAEFLPEASKDLPRPRDALDLASRCGQVLDMVAPERLPRHPVDAIQQIADDMGLETDPEKMAAARAYCDAPATDDQLTRVDGDPLLHSINGTEATATTGDHGLLGTGIACTGVLSGPSMSATATATDADIGITLSDTAVDPGRKAAVTNSGVTSFGNATHFGDMELLPEGEKGPFTLALDMDDAPAADGQPEHCPICAAPNPCPKHDAQMQRVHLKGLAR